MIAPDLLGLGDTIVRLDDDYRLPNQVRMVVGLLDWLGIGRAHFVGHDHGGAIVQLMMNSHIVEAIRLGFGGRLRVVPSVADLHVTAEVAPGVSLDVDQFVRRAEARGIVVNTLADFSAEASPRADLSSATARFRQRTLMKACDGSRDASMSPHTLRSAKPCTVAHVMHRARPIPHQTYRL